MNVGALATVQMEDDSSVQPAAPPVQLEGYAVAATRALEAAKGQADMALMLLQYAPRQGAEVFTALAELRGAVDRAIIAYSAYGEVISCKGQC